MTIRADLVDDTPEGGFVATLPFGPDTAAALCALARSLGLCCARIDLRGCTTKDDMLARIGAALGFPDWYGANWDALFDCLNDLEWLPAPGYVLVVENTHDLREAASADFQVLLDILNETAAAWHERGVQFRSMLGAD